MTGKTVAILGAGPVGLAAAAHVLDRGMTPVILEMGAQVGHAVRGWGHVPMFSDWSLNTDPAAVRRLSAAGWTRPDAGAYPTGNDLARDYLDPLGDVLAPWLRLGRRVTGVYRDGLDKVTDAGRAAAPFVVETAGNHGDESLQADAVIDTTGTWFQPNPGGAGRPVPGEQGNPHVHHGMPDVAGSLRGRFAGRRVAVVGGGHSAAGNLTALAALPGTRPIWLCRAASPTRAIGGGAADQLAARGALGSGLAALAASGGIAVETGFRLAALRGAGPVSAMAADGRQVEVDEVIISTGFRPDLSILRELRVSLDPALECPPKLAPLIDPNLHSCGTVRPHGAAELAHPEPGFWIAGMKSYGRAPTFLLATGYEQVRSIVAFIAGDHAAAARVVLQLPETGICSGPPISKVAPAAGCCGGPAASRADACCAADEAAKDEGKAGCGCGTAASGKVAPKVAACC